VICLSINNVCVPSVTVANSNDTKHLHLHRCCPRAGRPWRDPSDAGRRAAAGRSLSTPFRTGDEVSRRMLFSTQSRPGSSLSLLQLTSAHVLFAAQMSRAGKRYPSSWETDSARPLKSWFYGLLGFANCVSVARRLKRSATYNNTIRKAKNKRLTRACRLQPPIMHKKKQTRQRITVMCVKALPSHSVTKSYH
jgi:hypothetical protein